MTHDNTPTDEPSIPDASDDSDNPAAVSAPWGNPSDFEDANDWFNQALEHTIDRLVTRGMREEEAVERAAEIVVTMTEKTAPDHAEALEANGKTFTAESATYRQGFAERLRVHWGNPLDLYEIVVDVVGQAGTLFAKRNIGNSGGSGDRDLLLDVLVQLNGQAIRVAREVHALLTAGFPLGAHALARTIHEISVRAAILAEFGTTDEHKDIAEKFVRHDRVLTYKDAVVYQRDAEALGYERLPQDTLDAMKAAHDALIDKYGKAYRTQYGWASGPPGLAGEPNFERLERVASLGHHRGLYKWASHFVHGDASSLRLNMVERGGSRAVLTNATNIMLADPGQQALHGLYRVFVSLVTSAEHFAFYDQLLCHSLSILIDKADKLFVEGERAVDDAEERFQAELAERGLRFDLVHGEVPLPDLDTWTAS